MNRTWGLLLSGLALAALAGCSRGDAEDAHSGHGGMEGSEAAKPAAAPERSRVELSAERVQRIGIRTEPAVRAGLTRHVRTVGIVRTDETRESHVHVKWEGWIEEIRVAFTGQEVKKGDPLFLVYSPELVAAQQEFVIALKRAALTPSDRTASLNADAARSRLRLWDVPEEFVKELEKTLEVRRLVEVLAPRDGTVIEKMALPGKFIERDMDLYTIADLSRVWVMADLYEYEAPWIRVGASAKFAPVGEPEREVEAPVAFVSPTVDDMSRTVKVRLEIANEERRFRPGAWGIVRLDVPLPESVVVPADAVLDTGVRQVLFVRIGDGIFDPREVKLGARAGDRVQVLEGVKEGEEVVTRGQFLLDSESRLRAASGGGHAGHGGH